jgi:hypothetical protein
MYGFIKFNYPRLYSLSCQVLMPTQDREPVKIRLHNTLTRELSYFVEAQFSSPSLWETDDQRLVLQPGESRKLAWEVGKENVDLGFFIFARVFTSATTAHGMLESTCGTLVLNLPFKGGPTIYYAMILAVVISMAIGLWLWFHYRDRSQPPSSIYSSWMIFISAVVIIGIASSFFNFWFVAIVMILLALLSIAVFLIPHKA